MKDKIIEVKNLSVQFEKIKKIVAVNDVSMEVYENEVLSIIGPSGGGKSTLLRTLNLLQKPSKGDIYYKSKNVKELNIDEYRQKIGMVFQHFNLFNNMTVIENMILAPCKVLKVSKQEATNKALGLLDRFNLKEFKDAYPSTLSGGQKQRVAILRTLMNDPELILFDEPTSALDPEMVVEVLNMMKELKDTGLSMVIVSHETNFVRQVSDRIIFIDDGSIIETGTSKQIFENPQNDRTKDFVKKVLDGIN